MKAGGFRENLHKLKKALTPKNDATAIGPGMEPPPGWSGAPKATPAPEKGPRKVAGLLTWPEPIGKLCKLVSWRSPLKNTRLLIAYPPGADPHDPLALVNVLVRDNRNFLPGMELQARKVDERTYELEGPCPPRRGRWR